MNKRMYLRRFWKDERGQDFIEYALIVGLVVVAAGMAMPNLGGSLSTIYSKVNSALNY